MLIVDLVNDYAEALVTMPAEHPRFRILRLFHKVIRDDINFIERHPTTLFQCMWNTCWWYDCSEAARHFDPLEGARTST